MRVRVHHAASALLERELSPAEFDARVAAALADADRQRELCELIRWFKRRYPTAEERLAYARRRYREIVASQR